MVFTSHVIYLKGFGYFTNFWIFFVSLQSGQQRVFSLFSSALVNKSQQKVRCYQSKERNSFSAHLSIISLVSPTLFPVHIHLLGSVRRKKLQAALCEDKNDVCSIAVFT